ncbi:hypothetical protein [Desulfocurvus sp. DL9XJH121]
MRRTVCALAAALALAAVLAAPALARDVDEGARTRIKKLQAQVDELEKKVTALQLLMQKLEDKNASLEKDVRENQALIRLLIKATKNEKVEP